MRMAIHEEERERLKDALQSAAYAEADAKLERDNAMKNAQRAVEDTLLPENADASLAVAREEVRLLQTDLADYQEVLNQEGIVLQKRQEWLQVFMWRRAAESRIRRQ